MSTTVATAASSTVGKHGSGADADAGTVNSVNAVQGGEISVSSCITHYQVLFELQPGSSMMLAKP